MSKLTRPIPHEVETALISVGIRATPATDWHRLAPSGPVPTVREMYVCSCGDSVSLFPLNLGRRRVLAGQCRRCDVIWWKERE